MLSAVDIRTTPSGATIPSKVMLVDSISKLDTACSTILSGGEGPEVPSEMNGLLPRAGRQDRTTMIAVDLEGANLSRTGAISLVTVATATTVYAFDVVELGHQAFTHGLNDVLTAPHILKLMYDCRTDCDALKYQFGAHIDPICDLQVTSMMYHLGPGKRNYLLGMKKAFEKFNVFDAAASSLKDRVGKLTFDNLGGDPNLWLARPLNRDLLDYSVADVKYFFVVLQQSASYAKAGHVAGTRRRDRTINSPVEIRGTAHTDFLKDL